jgi:hypothetical protein
MLMLMDVTLPLIVVCNARNDSSILGTGNHKKDCSYSLQSKSIADRCNRIECSDINARVRNDPMHPTCLEDSRTGHCNDSCEGGCAA